jgi:arsenate reductase
MSRYCESLALTRIKLRIFFRGLDRRRKSAEDTAMKATIWHNPNCGTSRKTLAILQETPGVEVTVVEYLKTPPSAEKLAQLYRDAGITPAQGLRLRGTDAAERGLPEAGDGAVLAAMAAEPVLIERPLVETGKGVRLCRPQEKVLEIL